MDSTLEDRPCARSICALLPFAVLSYVLAYIDRINVSFAGLTMRGDLGMSAGTFGLPSGCSTGAILSLRSRQRDPGKVGARYGSPRIMIAGESSPADRDGHGFDELRDRAASCSGVAEAGFFPGIILLLHLLVSEPSSRAHRVGLSGWSAGSGRDRGADNRRRFSASTACSACRAGRSCTS